MGRHPSGVRQETTTAACALFWCLYRVHSVTFTATPTQRRVWSVAFIALFALPSGHSQGRWLISIASFSVVLSAAASLRVRLLAASLRIPLFSVILSRSFDFEKI